MDISPKIKEYSELYGEYLEKAETARKGGKFATFKHYKDKANLCRHNMNLWVNQINKALDLES